VLDLDGIALVRQRERQLLAGLARAPPPQRAELQGAWSRRARAIRITPPSTPWRVPRVTLEAGPVGSISRSAGWHPWPRAAPTPPPRLSTVGSALLCSRVTVRAAVRASATADALSTAALITRNPPN